MEPYPGDRILHTAEAIRSYTLRLRRNSSFSTSLCVFCVRWRARKTHTNLYYNVWSPQATHLYGVNVPKVEKHLIMRSTSPMLP